MKLFYNRRVWLVLAFFVVAVVLLTSSYRPPAEHFHTPAELKAFRSSRSPIDSGEYFLGSVRCQGCHGYDTLHNANVDETGADINLYDDWESTMMAFSAKDPFWRAKVSHEILVNPGHSDALQTKCTSCHAPMGHFTAMFKGANTYTLADLMNDTLGLNGVACGGCHEIAKDSIGSPGVEYSGNIHYDTSKVEYGPFEDPLTGPMELYVGLIPTHSVHMSRSAVCSPCHTLLTATADLNGNLTGGHFIEQATYHEWLNSNFNSTQPCQSCHMPQIQDPVVIANNILNLQPRSPFNLHKFMGGNSYMLNLIKQNKQQLGITVNDANFDSTLTATTEMLQHATLDFDTKVDSIAHDTLYIGVTLTNKAGHKFPSGYPSRRAFIQFAVTLGTDTIFQSGMLKPDYEVTGQGNSVEPHYNVISDSTQVQIYEIVMGDVNSNFTTVLERAAVTLKDNRLPPAGFTTNHYAYDTAQIIGVPASDADFNRNGGTQGTGADYVRYRIALHGKGGQVHVASAVYYQTLPPRWTTEMFSYHSDMIDSFRNMYQASAKAPVLIANAQLDTTVVASGVRELTNAEWKVFPIPSASGNVVIENPGKTVLTSVEIYSADGRRVRNIDFNSIQSTYAIQLPDASGIYWLRINSGKLSTLKKVIRQ